MCIKTLEDIIVVTSRYVVELGVLNEDDDSNLIKKINWSELFQLDEMVTAKNSVIMTFLQEIVWNNNLCVPQFSQKRG